MGVRNERTVVFDLDGTLIDSLDSIRRCLNRTLKAWSFAPLSREQVQAFVGNSSRFLVQQALRAQKQPPCSLSEAETEALLEAYNAEYYSDPLPGTRIYDGIPALLQELSDAGLFLAVLSNKPDAITQRVVEGLFSGCFNAVVGFRESVARKPAPDSLDLLCKTQERNKDKLIYVGDTEVDAELGARAGVRTLLVSYGFRTRNQLKNCPCDALLDSVAALRNGLAEWRNE